MAGSPTTRAATTRWPATPLSMALLLLLLCGQLRATEPEPEAAAQAVQPIQPTRQSIYQHLTAELQAALGAEEHVRSVFAGVAQGVRDSVGASVGPSLQALVDGVAESAEDAWVAADDAGLTLSVKPCVDGAESDAQQVAKRTLEKVEGCVQAVEAEGELRVREAARLLNEIEDASKRFVTALEACVKEEAAKEEAQPQADAATDAATDVATDVATGAATGAATDAPTGVAVPQAEETARCSTTEGAAREGEATAARAADGGLAAPTGCAAGCKRKKPPKGESPKEEPQENGLAHAEDNLVEEVKNAQPSDERGEIYENEQKGKKGKDKIRKGKKQNANVDESVEVPAKNKDGGKGKGKNKKIKDGEAGKVEDRADKISKDAEQSENPKAEESRGERKEKKGKKEGKHKKEKGAEGGEGKKGRKKRDLLALNEVPEPDAAATATATAESPAPAPDAWPAEGATPEERRVIACMRSPAMKPLIEQKTRAYQRLQSVLQRTAARQQDAPACVTDHVRKAELKISAIKQRMASCADRKMRQDL